MSYIDTVTGSDHATMYVAGRFIENHGWYWGDDLCSSEVTDDLWASFSNEPDASDEVTIIESYELWGRGFPNSYRRNLCECTYNTNYIKEPTQASFELFPICTLRSPLLMAKGVFLPFSKILSWHKIIKTGSYCGKKCIYVNYCLWSMFRKRSSI